MTSLNMNTTIQDLVGLGQTSITINTLVGHPPVQEYKNADCVPEVSVGTDVPDGIWTVWHGDPEGPKGLTDDTLVDIRFRSGTVFVKQKVSTWSWDHCDECGGDIVAYRVSEVDTHAVADPDYPCFARYENDSGYDYLVFFWENLRGKMVGSRDNQNGSLSKVTEYTGPLGRGWNKITNEEAAELLREWNSGSTR